jgi:7-carboxy-7-deazaguanine synthase
MMAETICPWAISEKEQLKCIISLMSDCPFAGDNVKCDILQFAPYDKEVEMDIVEIYPAISGEGASTGKVCVIVRTAGCNLRCSYCDTTYAYEGGIKRKTQDVVDEVLSYGINTVLFTGGEPLLNRQIASNFLRAMLEYNIDVYVETNGSVDVRGVKLLAHIVLDVKTPSSGMHEHMYWRNLGVIGNQDEVKFVLSDRADYEYAKKIIEEYRLPNKTPYIFFSPVWKDDMSFVKELAGWMINDKVVARLMLQQHKVIYGKDIRSV